MSSSFYCKWGCGSLLYCNPKVKTEKGKLLPISRLSNLVHECHLDPHWRGKFSKIRAKAVLKEELDKIDAWQQKQEQEQEEAPT